MSQRIQWIGHKGKQILMCNYADIGLSESEFLIALEDVRKAYLSQPRGKVVLNISEVTATRLTPAIINKGKEILKVIKDQGVTNVVAAVGVDGAKKIIAQLLMPDIYCASTVEDAKEWLVNR